MLPRDVLVLFDLDHTLTARDTFLDFARWECGVGPSLAALIAAVPAVCAAGRGGTNTRLKERVVASLWQGRDAAALARRGDTYAVSRLPYLLRPRALERLRGHRRAGHTVCVVTASLDLWVRAWCAQEGVALLATGLEVVAGRVTGRLHPPNCHGAEKVRRAVAHFGTAHRHVVAYGDSAGDREMLAWADEPHYRCF